MIKFWKVEQVVGGAEVVEKVLSRVEAEGGTVFAVDLSGFATIVSHYPKPYRKAKDAQEKPPTGGGAKQGAAR